MPSIRTCAMLALLLAAPAQAIVAPPAMPVPLRGVWMVDNPAGQAQCTRYKAALKKSPDEARNQLVGSEVIHRFGQHSYAEYGEGNFYATRSIIAQGKTKWRLAMRLGLDGPPEGGPDDGTAVISYDLRSGKLVWKLESINGKPVGSRPARRYFRCADVPRGGFYAS